MVENEKTAVYKERTVLYSGIAATLGFISTAAITWETRQGTTITYFLRLANLHSTKEDAVVAALVAAKAWIDNHGAF